MNDKKICFIISVKDELSFEECLFYINNLQNPNHFTIDIIPMRNFKSLASAYNFGLTSSDAKYKVYLHDDVFITNKDFINNLINIFNLDNKIGLIGMCGPKKLPSNGIWWESSNLFGKVYDSSSGNLRLLSFNEITSDYEEVNSVDGLLIATQYDLKWREDLFNDLYFYDISQSLEFINQNYKVIVPKQDIPWCSHHCGIVDSNDYELNRKIFIDNYSKFL